MLDSVTSKDIAVAVQKAERSRAVRRDLILDLPTRVSLPDGEELPYGSSRHFRIRDTEQVGTNSTKQGSILCYAGVGHKIHRDQTHPNAGLLNFFFFFSGE